MSRSRRTRLWAVWALRDARRRWLQVISIALLLALGIGMFSAMSSMSKWRKDSAAASYDALRAHDLRVALAEGSYAREGSLARALDRVGERRAVEAADERLVVATQVDASFRGRSVIVPGRIVGATVAPSVDALHVVRGRALTPRDSGAPVAELERNFAKYHDLPPSGTVRLAGGRTLHYAGQASAPEYFVVTPPGATFGGEAGFAVLFAPLRTAQSIAGRQGRVNELVLRVAPGADLAAVQSQLATELRRALPGTGFTFTRQAAESAHRLLFKDADGDQRMMDIFALLLLGAAALAAFNLVSRAVESQRREIGIGMALGVMPRALAARPFLLGGQISLLGIALGVPTGLLASEWLRSVIESFFPLPVVRTPFQAGPFLVAAGLGVALPLLATALPVWRALRVTPVDAIKVGARAASSTGLAWLVKGLRLPGGSLANMPLRNVLRTPRRTLMTVLGIGAVVAIVIALSGLIDSFDRTLAESRGEALAGSADRLVVDLDAPQPATSALVGRVTEPRSVGAAEPSLRLPATLSGRSGARIDATVEVVNPSGQLWHPTLTRGTLPADGPGLVIARRAADDLHVGIGDAVAVRHPAPTGPLTFALVSTPLRVTGIHSSPLRFVAYAAPASAPALHVAGLVNRLSVVPADGASRDAVKRDLLRVPGVVAVQGASAMTDTLDERLDQFTDVLVVTVAIAIAMSLLIAFNTSAINADERARDDATMFAYGVPLGRVLRANMAELLVIGLLGTAIGVAAGWALLEWVLRTSVAETQPDLGALASVDASTYAMAVTAGTVIVAFAPLLTLRRLRRADIPTSLRVVE